MNAEEFQSEKLSDARIVELLSLALSQEREGDLLGELDRLAALPQQDLVADLRHHLEARNLDSGDGARLIGVSEATVHRWFQTAEPLTPRAKRKMAGLCMLLALADEQTSCGESRRLLHQAFEALKSSRGPTFGPSEGQAAHLLVSVFGPAGLGAAAVYAMLRTEEED